MAKNMQMIKMFLALFFCTLFIFGSSYVGSRAVEKNTASENQGTATTTKVVKQTIPQSAVPAAETVIAQSTVELQETPEELLTFVQSVSKIDIPAQANFSFLDFVKKKGLGTMDSDTLSIIATGIYQTVLSSNFVMEERDIGEELPDYAKLGFAAKVNAAESDDLAFQNPNSTGYVLSIQVSNNALSVTLKGRKLPYDYKIAAKQAQQLKPKTIIQYSPFVPEGQTKVKEPGKNGQSIKIYREAYQGDFLKQSELVSNDYYPPEYRVEVHALKNNQTSASGADSTVQTSTSTTDTGQTNQASQTSTGDQSAASEPSTSQNTNDNDLWGKNNETVK